MSKQVNVINKSLKLLECFINRTDLGISDMVKVLGFPKTTVFRLVNTLEENGYLVENLLTKKYRLGKKAFLLAAGYMDQNDLRKAALPVMASIRDLTRETVILSVLDQDQRLLLDYVPGLYELVYIPKLGRINPLNVGASSKVILAFLEKGKIDEIICKYESGLKKINNSALLKDLEKIREQGYFISFGEREEGLVSVSAPILDGKSAVGSIALGFPEKRFSGCDMDKYIRSILDGAKEISLKIGDTRL